MTSMRNNRAAGCKQPMPVLVAVDPGTVQSAYCVYTHGLEPKDMEAAIVPNRDLERRLGELAAELDARPSVLVLEMIESFGMAVGASTFETAVWIGRLISAWGGQYTLIGRRAVKLALCRSARARDANVRQALIDRHGPLGRKKEPGPTFGFRRDMWSALAVATAYADMLADASSSETAEAPGRLLAADVDAREG
jgi:hypothetical protein